MSLLRKFFSGKPSVKIDTSLSGSHGSHWGAVLLKMDYLDEIIQGSSNLKYLTKLFGMEFGNLGKKTVAVHKFGLQEPLYCFMAKFEAMEKQYELATAYPVLETRFSYPCRVSVVHEWPIKIEAQIDGNIKEPHLSFFATDYFLKKDEYKTGKTLQIEPSGIAYAIEKLEHSNKKMKDRKGKEYDISKTKATVPLQGLQKDKGWMVDDYHIWAEIKSMKKLKSKYVSGYILHVDMNPLEDIEIFASEKVTVGNIKIGDMISADVWLQGRIAGEEWNILGDKDEK